MKEMLNAKNPKIYAEMYISRMPKNNKRILMYGTSDKRSMEIILDSFQKTTFVIADREANNRLLNHFYKGKKFTYINTTDDENDLTLFEEEGEIGKMPKFDVAIINPPYDGHLHLKILEKVIYIADYVISISPIDWLMNPYGGAVYNQYKHLKFNSIENVGLIKNIFNGLDRSTYTGGIYTIDKNANKTPDKFLYKFISTDFTNYIDEKILSSIIKKTIDCDNLENHIISGEINDKTKYTIVMPKLVGNPGEKTYKLYVKGSRWDKIFYKGLYKGKTVSETKKKLKNVKNYTIFDYIEFNTKNEAENWIKSSETNFIKFMQIIQSVDSNRRCSHTPFMSDYSKPWTDKRFCEYFGITGYISDTEAEPNSEWETILNSMKEYK